MIDQLARTVAYIKSFGNPRWTLEDYPVRVRANERVQLAPNSRFKPVLWSARILGWGNIMGHGDTRDEALLNLRARFQEYLDTGKTPPRPGTERADFSFAPADRVAKLEDVAPKFFREIIGIDFRDCLITDESSLWDFHFDADNETMFKRIDAVYGVDVRDIESGDIADILERLRLLSSAA